MLELEQVVVNYPEQSFTFNLRIPTGQRVAIVGESGSGKTTILKALAGFVPVASGKVQVDGKVVNKVLPGERGLSYMTQAYNHLPHLSLRDNIALAFLHSKLTKAQQHERITHLAQQFQLESVLDKLPASCSGGQLQRAALIRSLLQENPHLLFDEPFSALDAENTATIVQYMRDLPHTQVVVTHNLDSLEGWVQRVIRIAQGRIVSDEMVG